MRERIWRRLEHNGAVRDDPSTWRPHQANGLRPSVGPTPTPATSPVFAGALDDLFGAGRVAHAGQLGPGARDLPDRRARGTCRTGRGTSTTPTDQPPGGRSAGVNVFLFVDDVEPRGGGTVVVRGSPRHVERFVERARPATRTQKQWRTAFDASHPVVHGAERSRPTPRIACGASLAVTDIDGVPTQVVELTGQRRRRRGVPPVADPQHRAQRAATDPG